MNGLEERRAVRPVLSQDRVHFVLTLAVWLALLVEPTAGTTAYRLRWAAPYCTRSASARPER